MTAERKQEQTSSLVGLMGLAAVAGIAIGGVDNFALSGEISPIVIVFLLLLATASIGVGWRSGRWAAALCVWAWLPLMHFVKHAFGMPDTLHPNTYLSIAMLAAFSLVVSLSGLGAGTLIRSAMVTASGADAV